MKHSKLYGWLPSALVGLAMSASAGFGQTITLNTYDTATEVTAHTWSWYGGAVWAWDSTQDHTANGGGSIYISHAAAAGDTIIVPQTSFAGSGVWWGGNPIDASTYTNVSLWFKWDTNYSTMPISTMNTEGNGGFGISIGTNPNFDAHRILAPVPDAASNGWVQMNFPLTPTTPGIGTFVGVTYVDWKPNPWSGDVGFWIDDVTVQQGFVYIPPPLLSPVVPATSGLNVSLSTSGNTFYDRQSIYNITNLNATSWYGVATAGNPVSYSFTIKSMPSPASATAGAEAWFFMSPNPTGLEGAPDWNEANMVIAFVQDLTNGNSILHFQYKINEPSQQGMYSGNTNVVEGGVTNNYGNLPGSWDGVTTPWLESGDLGSVTNVGSAVGTWTITFTSDTNVTLTAPVGNTSSFVIPPYNVGNLAPGAGGMRMFLGGQANNAASLNQQIVYSSFSLTGTPAAFTDNFLADATLDTNVWSNAQATGPAGVLVLPSSAKYWAIWTQPANFYSLECGNQVADLSTWTSPSMYPVVNFNTTTFRQVIDSSEVPAGPNAFFNCIKRAFTQLQVLLPGETAAPGTPTGKTGTPTDISLGAGGNEDVTVNGVDATWHIVNSVSDSISLGASGGGALLPNAANMVNGTISFTGVNAVAFTGPTGAVTITATDNTPNTPAIPVASSASVNLVP